MGCSKGLGSALVVDMQRHICDLFLLLTRILHMKSFYFQFLFLKMRLMIVLEAPIKKQESSLMPAKSFRKQPEDE